MDVGHHFPSRIEGAAVSISGGRENGQSNREVLALEGLEDHSSSGRVAELADAGDLKSPPRSRVRVRVPARPLQILPPRGLAMDHRRRARRGLKDPVIRWVGLLECSRESLEVQLSRWSPAHRSSRVETTAGNLSHPARSQIDNTPTHRANKRPQNCGPS